MSYDEVATGELAAVVTFLEMRAAPDRGIPPSTLSLRRVERPQPSAYRALFRKIGAPWLWFSRLAMTDAELGPIIAHPRVELYEVVAVEPVVGMVELDFREDAECELAFIGLVPELAGLGHGRWLLAEALRRAWAPGVKRVHVHTCSLDHPAALGAYLRAGFTPYKRAVERFPDPRLAGLLPADCAPQVPLLGTAAALAPPPAA